MRHKRTRRGQRIKTRLKTVFSAGSEGGEATLAEISYSGARLSGTPLRPEHGTSVSVYVWLERQAEPFELVGRVANHREDGFAIEYEKPGQDVCQMVDLAAATVGAEDFDLAHTEEHEPEPSPKPERLPLPRVFGDLDLTRIALLDLEALAARVDEEIAQRRKARG
jgi:hypothetical protein